MFERYLTDALTTHFGHVIENLDADKIRLSAWSGELVLKDLSLRPDALNSFVPDCPVKISHGTVGNLELRIPWKLFKSQLRYNKRQETEQPRLFNMGCSVVLSDVNILITPCRKQTKDEEDKSEEEQESTTQQSLEERRAKKEKTVQSLLDANLLQRVAESSVASSRWKWVHDYVASLLSTLSVTVKNVHIRYEDPGTSMGFVWSSNDMGPPRRYRPAFAVGITLREFSVQTPDPQSAQALELEPGSDDEDKDKVETNSTESSQEKPPNNDSRAYIIRHKVAAAVRLAIYWDSDCQLMSSNSSQMEERTQQSAYYASAFEVLNDGSKPEFSHQSHYQLQHSYVLDPISPSVDLALVSKSEIKPQELDLAASVSDDSSTDSSSSPPQSEIAPPSSVRISLPPCKFTIARNTLEDTTYIRKSLSVWNHATKGLLSESSLRRLTRLRPPRSPSADPRGWWIYACKATMALLRVSLGGRDENAESTSRKQKRGWLGLAQALGQRRRYVNLYDKLAAGEKEDVTEAHAALVAFEDDLFPEEIVAFRIAVYESMKQDDTTPEVRTPQSQSKAKSRWQGWMMPSIRGNKDESVDIVANVESSEMILSFDHRQRMVYEMQQILEREKINTEKRLREGERRASVSKLHTADLHSVELNPVFWEAAIKCSEFSVQVNDQATDNYLRGLQGRRITPVVRLSCAWVQEYLWYLDGSWDLECSLAALVVKDLTGLKSHFPNLVGRRRGTLNASEKDLLLIDGQSHHRSMSVVVSRKLEWPLPDGRPLNRNVDRGSTTRTQIRLLPIEFVYSTVPVEALSRVLGSVKTPELEDDYQRMAAVVYGWRERQKTKLLQALAHKHKKIIIDVDVGAPEILIPEDLSFRDSPMVSVDLGRLRIFNEESTKGNASEFDDQWRLVLSDVQVQCMSASGYTSPILKTIDDDDNSRRPQLKKRSTQQLVEPFSLDFAIKTKVVGDSGLDPSDRTRVQIFATLPRLAFNLTSSAMRLVLRLQQQWDRRKIELQAYSTPIGGSGFFLPSLDRQGRGQSASHASISANKSHDVTSDSRISRIVRFQFSAPLISLRLANDVDGRDSVFQDGKNKSMDDFPRLTPLVDLSFRGIRGTVVQEVAENGISMMTFDARLHSLGVIDLYQNAGKDYALLMSSVSPELLTGRISAGEECSWQSLLSGHEFKELDEIESDTDLVKVEYKSKSTVLGSKALGSKADIIHGQDFVDKLSIWFHELYIEWNPETLAAIQKAMRMPLTDEFDTGEVDNVDDYVGNLELQESSDSEDEFYDAMDEEFFDAGSETDSEVHLISEVSSSVSNFADLEGAPPLPPFAAPSLLNSNALNLSLASSSPLKIISLMHLHSGSAIQNVESREAPRPYKPFEFVFKLSKLRVSFNKETRHRKLMIAQMSGTSVGYTTRPGGGSRTKLSIGNLVFTDPASTENKTLYGQILGLKLDLPTAAVDRPSSLLEMEILINPRKRHFSTATDHAEEEAHTQSVTIDREKGVVVGCNSYVRATFSPMRFVFLEQLWFEFMDYFFEGIIGTEVWGGNRKPLPSPSEVQPSSSDLYGMFLRGSDAEGLNFTRFNISLQSPVVLLPVTYRSSQFVRLELDKISVSNHYDSAILGGALGSSVDPAVDGERMQWYNNCAVALQDLRIFSWCGKELGRNPFTANITANWPVGPSALLIKPKWKVQCHIDSLDVSLRRCDYALLQHVISFNIGELSRNLDEWEALQTLSPREVELYKKNIMVHFGYDIKDVTPTTYDFSIFLPSVSFSFIDDDKEDENPLAIARCHDFVYQLKKLSDLVSRQRATCDIELIAPNGSLEHEKLLSVSKYDSDIFPENEDSQEQDIATPELTYTSTTKPTGDNVKTLEIAGACIYTVVPSWKRFMSFFRALPTPTIVSIADVASSIQVGDRWYRIGSGVFGNLDSDDTVGQTSRRFSWIPSHASSWNTSEAGRISLSSTLHSSPSFQLRVLLTSPRIILSSIPTDGVVTRLILRMHHLDYLHVNNGVKQMITRACFLHDVEVYTSSNESTARGASGENSLIHPWCAAGVTSRCNGESNGDCEVHSVRVSADVLKARAAYSDMAIAIDVCLSVLHDAKESNPASPDQALPSTLSSDSFSNVSEKLANGEISQVSSTPEICVCESPKRNLVNIEFDGFELLVVDDSGRHFARTQDLIILSLGKVLFSREDAQPDFGSTDPNITSSMHLRLHSLDLFDCLQSEKSPFRLAASSRLGAMGLQTVDHSMHMSEDSFDTSPSSHQRRMAWQKFSMVADSKWGFSTSSSLMDRTRICVSDNPEEEAFTTDKPAELPGSVVVDEKPHPELIELHSFTKSGVSRDYHVKLRSLAVQWNPSTIIAIQRFLGRLRKETKMKAVQVFNQQFDDLISPRSNDAIADEEQQQTLPTDTTEPASKISSAETVRAVVEVEELTVCLNKEHQHRRLLEATFSVCQVNLESSELGLTVDGQLQDFNAWDSDNYEQYGVQGLVVAPENRSVLKVASPEEGVTSEAPSSQAVPRRSAFVEVHYKTFVKKQSDQSYIASQVPKWVQSHLSSAGDVDDYLSLSIAALQFTYLRERTEEILDYLSNGLPGKGMGATSRAAKGFLSKRIVTKSFLELHVVSPQVLVPQHEAAARGLELKLGKCRLFMAS
jgi:hypothetical protein